MYVDGSQGTGEWSEGIATLISPAASIEITECVMFYYNLKEGGIASMSVVMEDSAETQTTVWHLSSIHDTGEWYLAQVLVTNAVKVLFVVEKAEETNVGFATVDEISARKLDRCTITPEEATPNGPSTTSAPSKKLPSCDFETDQCGWSSVVELNTTHWFHFDRTKGSLHWAGVLAPHFDHNNDTESETQTSNCSQDTLCGRTLCSEHLELILNWPVLKSPWRTRFASTSGLT